MKIGLSLSGLVASIVILFTISANAQPPSVRWQRYRQRQAQNRAPSQNPVVALAPVTVQLLGPGTGWAASGGRLLWTTDNGAHWKDISPPNPNIDGYADVSFVDEETGWVLLVGEPREGECADGDNSESDSAFHLAATVDGGQSWTETHVKVSTCDSGDFGPALSGSASMTFTDKLHGWIMLEHQSGSAFSFGSLLATSNGGRTWHETKGYPGFYGEIRAFPNGTLWAAKGRSGDDELAVSRNGGGSFEDVTLSVPHDILPAADATYGLPAFPEKQNKLHGYESVRFDGPEGTASAAILFETHDGGRTWTPDRAISNLPWDWGGDEAIPTSVVDST